MRSEAFGLSQNVELAKPVHARTARQAGKVLSVALFETSGTAQPVSDRRGPGLLFASGLDTAASVVPHDKDVANAKVINCE